MWSQFCEEANKVENNKIYNDDVERIVNDPERMVAINNFHYNRNMKRKRKLLTDSVLYAAVGGIFGVFGAFGLTNPVIAVTVAAMFGIFSAFCLGRWFEHAKCRGWN